MDTCTICGFQFGSPSFGGPGICSACDCGIPVSTIRAHAEMQQLRAENERLTADVAVWNARCQKAWNEADGPVSRAVFAEMETARLRAENARLREALERMSAGDHPNVARRALQTGTPLPCGQCGRPAVDHLPEYKCPT